MQSPEIADILTMSGTEFEHFVAGQLRARGYQSVKHVGGSGDRGVDLWCRDPSGARVAVQCKRWAQHRKVPAQELHLFASMMMHHRVQRGIFVTTSRFTAEGVAFAKDDPRHILLIDGSTLLGIWPIMGTAGVARTPSEAGSSVIVDAAGNVLSYRRPCRYCKVPIEMRRIGPERWKPFGMDGNAHDCRAPLGPPKAPGERVVWKPQSQVPATRSPAPAAPIFRPLPPEPAPIAKKRSGCASGLALALLIVAALLARFI